MELTVDVRPGDPGGAGVITARDLSSPGWCFDPLDPGAGTAVVGGRVVAVADIEAVRVVEGAMRPDGLRWVAAEDRAYAAAEMTASMAAWLALLPAAVDARPPKPVPLDDASGDRPGDGRPLLLGSSADGPVSEVCAELYGMGCVPLVLDETTMVGGAAYVGDGEVLVHRDGSIPLAELSAAYLRPATVLGPAQLALLKWADGADGTIVNRPSAAAVNNSKPRQLHAIAECGFDVPATLVTTSSSAVHDFVDRHGRVVFKSASGVRSIATELSDERRARLAAVSVCPTMFQQLVEGVDVRVHVVGSEIFAAEVKGDSLDYRYSRRLRMSSIEVDSEVSDRVLAMVRRMGLHVAGVDFIRTPEGRWVCLEVNPSPGFTYFSNYTGQPLASAIASLLAGRRSPARGVVAST